MTDGMDLTPFGESLVDKVSERVAAPVEALVSAKELRTRASKSIDNITAALEKWSKKPGINTPQQAQSAVKAARELVELVSGYDVLDVAQSLPDDPRERQAMLMEFARIAKDRRNGTSSGA